MPIIRILILALAAMFVVPASAQTAAESLNACLADNTTGKERKDLARWIFVAMAAHPDMQTISIVNDKYRDQINQSTGMLVTRLLTVNCATQARTAMQTSNGQAMKDAFGFLGQIAMRELMNNESVLKSIGGFEQYLDRAKIQATLAPVQPLSPPTAK